MSAAQQLLMGLVSLVSSSASGKGGGGDGDGDGVLPRLGFVCAEAGLRHEGKRVLEEVLKRDGGGDVRESGEDVCAHEVYMYLSQLSEGEEALRYADMGVRALEEELRAMEEERKEGEAGGDEKEAMRRNLCAALCARVEAYLEVTAWTEGEGDHEALAWLMRAREMDPTSAEPLQAAASVHLSMGQKEEARALMMESLGMWCDPMPMDAMDDDDDERKKTKMEGEEMEEEKAEKEAPSIEFRYARCWLIVSFV